MNDHPPPPPLIPVTAAGHSCPAHSDLERLAAELARHVAARLTPNVPLIAFDIDRQFADGDQSSKTRTIDVSIKLSLTRWEAANGYTARCDIAWCRKHQTKDAGAPLDLDIRQLDLPIDLPIDHEITATVRVIHPDGTATPELHLGTPAPHRKRRERTA